MADLPLSAAEIKTPFLLAWKYEADERPFYLESALLVIEMKSGNWRLLKVIRHPQLLERWHIATVDYHPDPGRPIIARREAVSDFASRPGPKELAAIIDEAEWRFAPWPGLHLLKGDVFYDNWQQAFGFKPDYRFTSLPDPSKPE